MDCVVQLPDKMFIGTAIPSALIFLDMNRNEKDKISKANIESISKLYQSFKKKKKIKYNVKGYSWASAVEEVLSNGCKLMPSIFTGVEEIIVDQKENEAEINNLKATKIHCLKG